MDADCGDAHCRVSLEAERRNGDEDEGQRNGCQHLKHFDDATETHEQFLHISKYGQCEIRN